MNEFAVGPLPKSFNKLQWWSGGSKHFEGGAQKGATYQK
jgi:hypothetical protein